MWQRIGHIVTAPWRGTVWAVDRLLHVWAKSVNPQHAVAIYVVFNSVVTVWAFVASGTTNDFYTISGYCATLSGLLVGLGELYRARTLAEHLERVVLREIDRQRGRHYRYCLERAKNQLALVRVGVSARQWPGVSIRVEELAAELIRIHFISPAVDDRWRASVGVLRAFIPTFEAGRTGKRLTYETVEWDRTVFGVQDSLEAELAQFQYGGGESHDPD